MATRKKFNVKEYPKDCDLRSHHDSVHSAEQFYGFIILRHLNKRTHFAVAVDYEK